MRYRETSAAQALRDVLDKTLKCLEVEVDADDLAVLEECEWEDAEYHDRDEEIYWSRRFGEGAQPIVRDPETRAAAWARLEADLVCDECLEDE